MTDLPDLSAPDAATRRLLDAEKLRDELPEIAIDDAWRALAAKLPAVGVAPVAPAGPASPATPGVAAATSTARLAKLGAVLLVTFGAGVLAGRQWPAEAPRVAERPSAVAPTPTEPPRADAVPVVPIASAEAAVSSRSSTSVPSPPRSAPPPTLASVHASPPASAAPIEALADERALVEGARTALLRGRPSDALALALKHEARFPLGELAEDRDFMIASALRDLGRVDEARLQARRFLARYPKSALRPAAETMMQE